MLQLSVKGGERYDEEQNLFIYDNPFELRLEHSLVSISKWEMKWELPFLKCVKDKALTNPQMIDYVRCMTMNQNVPDNVYFRITLQDFETIWEYIDRKMTAAWISSTGGHGRTSEVVTSDLIYYWMFSYGIPKDCEKWHLNRLLMLIDIFAIKNSSGKKMSRNEIYQQNRALNEARKAKYKTKG